MTDITISNARSTDVSKIVSLLADDPIGQQREDVSHNAHVTYVNAFEAALADPNCTILVARSGTDTIGCIQMNVIAGLSYRGIKRVLIEDMRISTAFRGKGIGRLLLEAALHEAQAQGCGLAELFAHQDRKDAHAFYEACGFHSNHKGFRKML